MCNTPVATAAAISFYVPIQVFFLFLLPILYTQIDETWLNGSRRIDIIAEPVSRRSIDIRHTTRCIHRRILCPTQSSSPRGPRWRRRRHHGVIRASCTAEI
jgi:hypothetical protein|uniref:Uncharacterized protein n=1 Tax=Sipha flava TaxID=143950 RepID=A0A2S2R3I5_9HEMI